MTWKNDNRDRWLNSFSWLWLLAFGGLGSYIICSPENLDSHARGTAVPFRQARSMPHLAVRNSGTQLIETIRVGMRVLGNNPDASEVDETLADPEPAQWRKLSLRMTKGNGDVLSIELLRPLEWLSFYEVAVGRTINLDLSEMGAEGPAEVLAVEPCPPIQSGPGNVVTGTFAHKSAGDLINLYVAGEPRPIGVTRNHRYWSGDRREFVAAGDLRPGERLATGTGRTAAVVAAEPRSTDEPVYNLEVHQHHVYRVGRLGALVHNSYSRVKAGMPLPDDEIIVMGNSKPGNFVLRPGVDDVPLPSVAVPGKSASIALDMTLDTEIRQMFRRAPGKSDILSGAQVSDVRAAGFDAIYAPTSGNTRHVRIIARDSQFDEVGREWLSLAFDRLAKKSK